MQRGDELLTTRLLDEEIRIGPFFFREFVLLLLGLLSSALVVVLSSLFVDVPGVLILLVPAGLLLLVGLLRMACKGQVTYPWYLHHWVARRFVRPQHLVPQVKPYTTQIVKSLNQKIVSIKRPVGCIHSWTSSS